MLKPLAEKLNGKVALVTGASSGIGKEIAWGLARLGAEVILGVRSPEKGEAARREIAQEPGIGAVSVAKVDLASLESIRTLARSFEGRPLHILVNNAGAWFTDRRESADGIELTFATNVMGPYLLSQQLSQVLKRNAPARILNVVSSFASGLDPTDLEYQRRKYDGFKAYAASKQALRMVTWGLAKRLEGSGVTVNAVEPGFVRTDLNRNAHGLLAAFINLSARLMARSPAEGADTAIWAAASAGLTGVTGKFFGSRKEKPDKFGDPAAIASLEQQCEQLATRSGAPSAPRQAVSSARAESRQ